METSLINRFWGMSYYTQPLNNFLKLCWAQRLPHVSWHCCDSGLQPDLKWVLFLFISFQFFFKLWFDDSFLQASQMLYSIYLPSIRFRGHWLNQGWLLFQAAESIYLHTSDLVKGYGINRRKLLMSIPMGRRSEKGRPRRLVVFWSFIHRQEVVSQFILCVGICKNWGEKNSHIITNFPKLLFGLF